MPASERGNSYYASFLKCRQFFYWQHVEGLEPKSRGKALSIGSAIHEGLRAYYRDDKTKSFEERVISAITAATTEIAGETEELHDDVINILDQYFAKYKDDRLEMIRSELGGELLIGGEIFTFRMDGLVRFKDMLLVKETKTTSLTFNDLFKQFPLDKQISGYTYAARRITGENVQGAIVDAIRKPRKPGGLCEFARDIFPRTEEELKLWETELIEIRKDIKRCEMGESSWYRNDKQCVTVYGECQYRRLCMFNGDQALKDTFYIKKERP